MAFGGHGAVLSVLLGKEGDGTGYFGEQPGISWPQDRVGGVRPNGSLLCARCCFQACLALVPQGFHAKFLIFVRLQHFICSFMFKITFPHADSFLLVSFLLLFLFP